MWNTPHGIGYIWLIENCLHFYGKYDQNRPSKNVLSTTPVGELCPVRLCLFFCTVLPDAPICITAPDEDEISYPELFCLLENLGDTGKKKGGSLRKMIADILSQPQKSNDLLEYARQNNCPILTTNFDFNIENAIGCKKKEKI